MKLIHQGRKSRNGWNRQSKLHAGFSKKSIARECYKIVNAEMAPIQVYTLDRYWKADGIQPVVITDAVSSRAVKHPSSQKIMWSAQKKISRPPA